MTPQVQRQRLQREWVLCAIAAAASRFVPVPVVDDLVKTRATRTAVSRTWTAYGRPDCPGAIGVLADDSATFWGGVARSVARAPLKLLLYPVRKVVRIVTAVRGVSTDLVGVVLLARSVDRCLAAGWFEDDDPRRLEDQARLVRRAHDTVVGTADLRVVTGAVTAALGEVGGLRDQAVEFAGRVFARDRAPGSAGPGTPPPTATTVVTTPAPATTADEAQVDLGVEQVVAVLDRPEVAAVLADLDRRFDEALAALDPDGVRRGGGPARRPR